ncbi:MAG: hypothetical protein Sylvanvirus2_27 [Sylvanvirus sp.]|uniref:Uncharacterized protein n=1 Tax=Sylvanvirus sp. TaxID=2487774 RepID=A0A3G5AJF5_9VIRU|nr:MAG: hypothetical protein Sylvanvirus2_27 [Sylvanvirus sp.]
MSIEQNRHKNYNQQTQQIEQIQLSLRSVEAQMEALKCTVSTLGHRVTDFSNSIEVANELSNELSKETSNKSFNESFGSIETVNTSTSTPIYSRPSLELSSHIKPTIFDVTCLPTDFILILGQRGSGKTSCRYELMKWMKANTPDLTFILISSTYVEGGDLSLPMISTHNIYTSFDNDILFRLLIQQRQSSASKPYHIIFEDIDPFDCFSSIAMKTILSIGKEYNIGFTFTWNYHHMDISLLDRKEFEFDYIFAFKHATKAEAHSNECSYCRTLNNSYFPSIPFAQFSRLFKECTYGFDAMVYSKYINEKCLKEEAEPMTYPIIQRYAASYNGKFHRELERKVNKECNKECNKE